MWKQDFNSAGTLGTLPGFREAGFLESQTCHIWKEPGWSFIPAFAFYSWENKRNLVFPTDVSETLNHPPGRATISQSVGVRSAQKSGSARRSGNATGTQTDMSCLASSLLFWLHMHCHVRNWIECLELLLDVDMIISILELRQVSEGFSNLPQVKRGLEAL